MPIEVFVVMGNDYPDCVFLDQEKASAYIKQKQAEDIEEAKRQGKWVGPGFYRVYWRYYQFTTQE